MAEIEKLMGVSAGDIEKVMGIEAGDITKVMGVELVTSIGYQGNRSLALGGFIDTSASVENIEYKALTSDGNTADFGDAAWDASNDKRSCGNDSRAVFMGSHDSEGGGVADSNNTEYLTIASTGNGTEFGDLLVAGVTKAGGSGNGIRGLYVGGQLPSYSSTDQIQYLTVATTGNTTDAGNLDRAANLTAARALAQEVRPVEYDTDPASPTFEEKLLTIFDLGESQSWNPRNGSYTYNIEWVYEDKELGDPC